MMQYWRKQLTGKKARLDGEERPFDQIAEERWKRAA
jgi:hypothetical protein